MLISEFFIHHYSQKIEKSNTFSFLITILSYNQYNNIAIDNQI
jgi:hypothetical protein